MYRKTKQAHAIYRRSRRAAIPIEDQRPDRWRPPELRRRITIEDFDGLTMKVHVIEMHRTNRIDSYNVIANGKPWDGHLGWSKVLDRIRRVLPRLASPRHFEE